jgi:hypothetical protein
MRFNTDRIRIDKESFYNRQTSNKTNQDAAKAAALGVLRDFGFQG